MIKIVQTIIAVLLGLFVAFLITVQFERLGNYLFPLPQAAPSVVEYTEYMASLPVLLHLLSILGFGLSIFLGAYVGGRLSPLGQWKRGAYITGFCYLLPIVVLLISFPRPTWAVISILVIIFVFTYLSGLILKKVYQNR